MKLQQLAEEILPNWWARLKIYTHIQMLLVFVPQVYRPPLQQLCAW